MWAKKEKWIGFATVLLTIILVVVGIFVYRNARLDQQQSAALAELERDVGQYDEQSIVLHDTSRAKAEELAELYGAELRITENGRFATLTLPEGTTIRDIYALDESRDYISEMAADYHVQSSDIVDEEETDTGDRLTARPEYSVSDEDYELQSYLDYLNMKDVWGSYTGSGITVAVIDTGIDTDHPEFAGRISEYSYNATEDKIVKDYLLEDGSYDWSLIEDEQGHGTAVTGVIAASMNSGNIVGIAPNVDIIVIKAECDENGNFLRTSDLVFGLYYAIERDAQVVNMSFGITLSVNPFAEATQLAYDSDILCVAAAGNDATSALCWPAADENVIGVGALDDDWELADYSNYGENTDLVAPGSTYTCSLNGGYKTVQGTSVASPIVAGAIALYMQTDKYATFDEVTQILYASSCDLGELGKDWDYGFGALDISAFIQENRGTITYDMLTDELDNEEGIFIQGHTLQELPEPERLYAVFDGWYYDDTFTQEYNYYEDKFYADVTLYAKWVNEDDGIPYTYVILDDGTVEIRSYTGHRRFITIPEKIEGRVVSSIGDFAFSGQSGLREVTLPSGLTHIGLSAFENCSNLVSIQIPENVTEIEAGAFEGNVRLSSVSFAGNSRLETIGDFAFKSCGKLEKIELPASLESVNGSAFYGATRLQTISVQKGNAAFESQNGVLFNYSGDTLVAFPAAWGTDYTVPEGTIHIADYAFSYAKLTTVALDGVQNIGEKAFSYAALETLTIPDSVSTIEISAFANNMNLAQLTIGRGITEIADGVFMGASSLKNVVIPNGIAVIKTKAFYNSGLENVIFEEGSALTSIGYFAFNGCSITEIDLPTSVLQIGSSAFSGNPLIRVGFAEDSVLNTIGEGAFACCGQLENISLPDSLGEIGDFAFQSTGLMQVTIPAGVTLLGDGAFACCSSLTAIDVEDGNTVYHDLDGIVHSLDNTVICAYPAGREEEEYVLEGTVRTIAPWTFAGTEKLGSIVLPEGMTVVGEYGVYSSGIMSVSLPESLEQIEQYAFSECSNLESVNIPDNVIQIGRYAFAKDWNLHSVTFSETSKLPRIGFASFAYSGLTSFTVPANVLTMAQKVFEGCSNLTSFTFAQNSKLESIPAYVFDGCSNLETITFLPGSALTSIQAHGLEGMDKLTSIDFGDAKLTNIDNFAFRFCESLASLNVPETVTNVGRYAFYGCQSLAELTLPETVEHIGSYAFLDTDDLSLYMKSETLPAYLDENWDYGIKGYYTGVSAVLQSGDYKYAVLPSGNIAILEYLGNETNVDLTDVQLGGNITVIGGSAFEDSTVSTLVLPDMLTSIQAEAFAYSDLSAVTIPANVTFIGREAFAYTDISSLDFAAGSKLAVVEQYAFAGTENLSVVTLPASLTTMGTGAFQESGLKSVTFAEGIQMTEIPPKAFAGTKLTSVDLPDSVILVNYNAFNNVSTLKSVSFGDNDGIRLMSNAFYRTGLTSLHIPDNVTYIGEYCFVALGDLTEFTVDDNNPNYTAVDGLLMTKNERKLIAVPAGRTGSLTVPMSVEEIGFGAFEESKLSEVAFHENANILSLGYRAFFKAQNITSITIPQSVVSIDYYAFAYCENLQEVIFAEGNQLKGIYEGAFLGDIKLESIEIPDSIVEISDFAFYGCTKINKIPISDSSAVKGIYSYAFAYTGLSGEFTTPEGLIDIGDYAFMGTKVTNVTIPDTNKKDLIIGIGAFEDCNQLAEITLPFIGAGYEDEEISWFGYIFGAGSYAANETYVPKSLKTVTITEGITAIYKGGFANCTGLKTINVPHSVGELWNDAFLNTTATYELTNSVMTYWWTGKVVDSYAYSGHFGTGLMGDVALTHGVRGIRAAFAGCGKLSGILLPNSVIGIGNYAFQDCTSLTNIIIPDSVESIGSYAFSGCTSLGNVTIGSGVTSIGYAAFRGCTKLTNILLPDNVTQIDSDVFANCSNLTDVTLSNSLTSIGYEAFYYCSGLTNIIIPDSVTSIDNYAFYACDNLTSVTIGKGVTSIGDSAFEYCGALCKVTNYSRLVLEFGSVDNGFVAYNACVIVDSEGNYMYKDSSWSTTEEGFLFSCIDGTYTLHAYTGLQETVTLPTDINGCSYVIYCFRGAKNIIIPDVVTSIDDCAFFGCSSLTNITIPDSVTSIDDCAFFGCSSLTNITIPDSVTSIGDSAFSGCSSLTNITIPDSVTSIGNDAFYRCSGLRSVSIPDSVISIGDGAFIGCDILNNINLCDDAHFRYVDGILYDKAATRILWVSRCVEGDVAILPSVTSIGDGAFSGCSNLTSITIPYGITSIADRAFYRCSSLRSISIPDSVTSIGDSAFYGCSSLISITIPDSVTSIGDYSLYHCSSLICIILPDNVSVIGSHAFPENASIVLSDKSTNYQMLDGILYSKDLTEIVWVSNTTEDILFPSNLQSIPDYAFTNCAWIKSVTIPDSVTSIGKSAFSGCTGLTSVTIGDGVTSIGDSAFQNCKGLTSVSIPDGVTNVGHSVFNSCSNLTTVMIGNGVTRVGNDAFSNCSELTSVYITNLDAWCAISFYNSTSNPLNSAHLGARLYVNDKLVTNLIVPDGVTNIGNYAFCGCSSLTSVTIPDSVTSIGDGAFGNCYNLLKVNNHSNLELELGKDDNGCVTSYACIVIDCNGNRIYKDDTWFETEDGFLFSCIDGTYTLHAYMGTQETVTLPRDINGCGYEISHFCGAKNVIIPDSVTSIGDYAFSECTSLASITIPDSITSIGYNAFSGCTSLTSITIPDSVTSIGYNAFSGCTSLTSIAIPDSVTNIGHSAFDGCTGLYTNPDYYQNGMLVIDGWLVDVDEDAKYLTNVAQIHGVVSGAYQNCYQLKSAVWSNTGLPSNVETLYITNINSNTPYLKDLPLTLKNIIICDTVSPSDLRYCQALFTRSNITGVTVYVEALEADLRWDDNFPGWNNGNLVIYGDKWSYANFYDVDGTLLSSEPVRNSQILHRPIYQLPADVEGYTYELLGWDLDGDGEPDSVPATTVIDINATAVVRKIHIHVYRDWYTVTEATCTQDGLEQHDCKYCDYSETRVIAATGHSYDTVVTAPTCTAQGYTTYTCLCGDSYVVSYVDTTGHSYGEWYTTVEATCTTDGEKRHDCGSCDHYETEVIEATGHSYVSVVTAPTCTEQGYTTHTCSVCSDSYVDSYVNATGHSYGEWYATVEATCTAAGEERHDCESCDHYETEVIKAIGHSYVSVVTAPTCTEQGYTTHTCSVCSDSYVDSYVNATGHSYGEWYTTVEATCTTDGEKRHDCESCDHYETEVIEATGHSYNSVVTEPTTTAGGYTTHTCTVCGDSYVDSYTDSVKGNPFTDVPESKYYFEPIMWAVENGITSGTSATTFAPEASCTRAQVVVFLWRCAGCPEPTTTENPFTDVYYATTSPFYKAILWAVEEGITSGTSATTFGPTATVNRVQFVTFLWRYMGKPTASNTTNHFTDMTYSTGSDFYKAIMWAVEAGVTAGKTATTFEPTSPCTRGQVVTFLHRALKDE